MLAMKSAMLAMKSAMLAMKSAMLAMKSAMLAMKSAMLAMKSAMLAMKSAMLAMKSAMLAMKSASVEVVTDESGSLVLLIFTLFLLALVSSLAIIDVSDSFLAKRELIAIGEVAVTRAAHEISLSRYYSGNILMDTSGSDGAQFRIPLDCPAAFTAFQAEISSSLLRGHSISITSWNCQNDEVTGTLQATIPLLIKLPFGIGTNGTIVTSTIGATSIIGGTRG